MKRVRLLILAVLVMCMTSACDSIESEDTSADSSSTPPLTYEDVAYSGDLEFYAAMADKSVCEDKIIEVTGEYTGKVIGLNYIGEIGDDFYAGFFFRERTDAVNQLEEGDIITIRGSCHDSADDKVLLNFCDLISVVKSESNEESLPELIPEDITEPTQEPVVETTQEPEPKLTQDPAPEPTPEQPPIVLAENELILSYSSNDIKYDFDSYQEAEARLRAIGFTNITTQAVYDLSTSLWDSLKLDEIETISIDGKTSFNAETIFLKDSSVVITYHALETDNPNIPQYSVSQLVDDLEDNALRAKETYRGKCVVVTGIVGHIDDNGDFQLLPENNKWSYYGVMCDIQSSHKECVAKMSEGDTVTVKGSMYMVGDVLGYAMEVYEIN